MGARCPRRGGPGHHRAPAASAVRQHRPNCGRCPAWIAASWSNGRAAFFSDRTQARKTPAGDPRQAWRGDHDAAAAAARPCPADAPRPPNGRDDYQLAPQGEADQDSFAAGQRLSALGASNRAAVDPSPTLATDSELDFPPIPPRQSPRRPLVCQRCALATAVFGIIACQPRVWLGSPIR